MIDKDTIVCACNSLTAGDIAECIKENNFTTMEELLDNDICPMGDKCESCRDEGINNDGINLPLVLALVKRSQL
jgi:bacterioferritin-associated ferredoxin